MQSLRAVVRRLRICANVNGCFPSTPLPLLPPFPPPSVSPPPAPPPVSPPLLHKAKLSSAWLPPVNPLPLIPVFPESLFPIVPVSLLLAVVGGISVADVTG